jgi:hypothetical protein
MKNIEIARKTGSRTDSSKASAAVLGSKHFRRLKWDELVVSGDFITNEQQEFEPWEGPSGFRADAFVKPIYRRKKR